MQQEEQTRDSIVDSAMRVFSEKGFSGTTVADIAAAAGVSIGTIYRSFASKEDLFGTLDRPELRFRSQAQEERRKLIVDAALKVFAQYGYKGATLGQVAAEAGISKATIYLHFRSKDDLFSALYGETPALDLLEKFERGEIKGPLHDNLFLLAYSFLDLFDHPDRARMIGLVLGELPRFPDIGRIWVVNVTNRSVACLAAYFRMRIAAGDMRESDPDFAAELFMGSLFSLALSHFVFKMEFERPAISKVEMARRAADMFIDGVSRSAHQSSALARRAAASPKRPAAQRRPAASQSRR